MKIIIYLLLIIIILLLIYHSFYNIEEPFGKKWKKKLKKAKKSTVKVVTNPKKALNRAVVAP